MKTDKVVRKIKKSPAVRSLNKTTSNLTRSAKKNVNKIKSNVSIKKPRKPKAPSILAAVLLLGLGIVAVGAYIANFVLGSIVIDGCDSDFE